MAEINLGNDTTINTTIANSNEITAEVPDINYITGYKVAEEERRANEVIRQENEADRIALYEDMENKLATGYFDGDDGVGLNYNWNNTSLGIKREDESEYSYTDLKGAKGDDGVSPSASVTQGTGSATITITDGSGTTTAVLYDGEKGDKGDKGDPGAIKTQVVQELPATGDENTIYLVPITPDVSGNNYAEYIYINGQWELLGKIGIATDLTDYYTKSQTDTLLNAKANMSDLSTVATSGSYNDLSNKPTNVSTFTNDANYVTSNGNATQTDEDTSLTFTNTLSAPMEIDLKGNTQQEQLSGKNLCDAIQQTYSFTANTTKYQYIQEQLSQYSYKKIYLTAGTKYYISYTIDNNTTGNVRSTPRLYLDASNNFANTTPNRNLTKGRKVDEYTPTTSGNYDIQYWMQNSNENVSISDFMISTSSNIDYEQYCGGIPSPNPDYPQDVNVVKGINTINVSGKNLLKIDDIQETTKNGITYSCSNGEITLNGTSTGVLYIDIQKDFTYGSYSLSDIESSTKSQTIDGYTLSASITNGKIFVGHNTVNGLWSIAIGNGRTYDNAKVYIQLEKGSTATTYEPYQNQLYGINLINSLFDISTIVKGDIANNYDTIRLCSRQELWLEAGTYTINTNMPSPFRFSVTINSVGKPPLSDYPTYSFDSTWQTTAPYTFTITTAGYCVIQLSKNNNATLTVDEISQYYIQLQKGTETTPYTSIELCKIGTYQDYFYKDSGKWYLHKEVGKAILDGTENWNISNTGTSHWYYICNIASKLLSINFAPFQKMFYSNQYINNDITNSNTITGFNLLSSATITNIRIREVSEDTVNNFKTRISSNNIIVYGPLATSTNTEITDTTLIEQLEAIASATSYEGETNINQVNNDLPFIITAEVFNDNYNGRYQSVLEMYKRLKDAE